MRTVLLVQAAKIPSFGRPFKGGIDFPDHIDIQKKKNITKSNRLWALLDGRESGLCQATSTELPRAIRQPTGPEQKHECQIRWAPQ